MDGLEYHPFDYHESRVHLLQVDLTKRSIRPVMDADAFPFLRTMPIFDAIEQGALAVVNDGYNTVWYHGLGYADQPFHALVVDREVWTTGSPGGGFGFLIAEDRVWIQQNRIRVVIHRPDHTAFEVENINKGHRGKVNAFTRRGGTNNYPSHGLIFSNHFTTLGHPEWWQPEDKGQAQTRGMTVLAVSREPVKPVADEVVLETRWPAKLNVGDEVSWVQRFGAPNVRHIISGLPGIVQNGVNFAPSLNLDPRAPNGPDGWWVRANPRTALGVSKNGLRLYIGVVEGRVPGSKGVRFKELAEMMLDHGAHDVVNIDGGGSSFMWTEAGGLVSDSAYGDGTLEGLRPQHWATAVF